jgi:hypothetical protein
MLVEFSGSQREREQTQLMRLAKSVAGGRQRDPTTITCRTCKRWNCLLSQGKSGSCILEFHLDLNCVFGWWNLLDHYNQFVHTSLCHIKLQLGCNLDVEERETHWIKLLGWFEKYSNQYLEIRSSSIIGPDFFRKHIWFNCCRWNKGSVLQLST